MHTMIPNREVAQAGDLIFFGGITSKDTKGILCFPYQVEAQTEMIVKRIESYLLAANLGLRNLVYVTVFLTDIRYYDAMNKAYIKVMPEPLPPRKVITGPLTLAGAVVEMTAIASVHPRKFIDFPI
ncbi:MAG: RidA family protein [Spirochaetales bacterium]